MLNYFYNILGSNVRTIVPDAVVDQVRKVRRRKVLQAYADAGVAFFHVPRTAGTSIASAIYGMHINHFPVSEMARLSRALRNLPNFSIVRNPWDRAASAWHFAHTGGGRDNLVRVRSPHLYRVPAFRTFEHFVKDWLVHRNLNSVDVMFRPQMYFLAGADGQLNLDHLGRFEDLATTERWLRTHIPAVREFPHLNAVDRVPYRQLYTPSSRDLIGEIYARDIECFGYDF